MIYRENMLQNLEPIIVPDPIAFWPPQPGRYVVAIILLVLTAFVVNK